MRRARSPHCDAARPPAYPNDPTVITVALNYDELADALSARLAAATTAATPAGFLDVDGAATFLASTPSAIRSLVKRDALPYYKAPHGRLLFDPAELEAWVRSG
jgi:hypothetical protein